MLVKCPRCGGIGIIPQYKHVEDGICFLCEGQKLIEQAEAEKFIIQEAKKDKRQAERNAKREAYCKECKERIDKAREERKNKQKIKHEPTVYEPYKYEGSAQEALDLFFKEIEDI